MKTFTKEVTALIEAQDNLCDVDYQYILNDMSEWCESEFEERMMQLIHQEEVIGYYQADNIIAEHGDKEVVSTVLNEGLEAEQLANSELVATVYMQALMVDELAAVMGEV